MEFYRINIENIEQMKYISVPLASFFKKNRGVIFLEGDLGAGKTTFTQFFAVELGVKDNVNSPTFSIMKRYVVENLALNHFDLYRIGNNVYDQGFEEYWFSDDISIIEWSNLFDDEFANIFKLKIIINYFENNRILNLVVNDEYLNIFVKEHLYEFIY